MAQKRGVRFSAAQIAAITARLAAGEKPQAIAAALGLQSANSIYQVRKRLAVETGADVPHPLPPGIPEDGFRVTRRAGQYDPDGALQKEWIERKRQPGEAFAVPAGHIVKGESALVDGSNQVLVKWVKTQASSPTETLVDTLRAVFADYAGLAPLVPAPAESDADLLTVYPLADLHLGMQSWGRETEENYDVRIAQARVRDVVSRLVGQSRPSRHAVILGLGDYFHSNDASAMTPRSKHILDVDGRWPRVLTAGVHTAMAIAEMALQRHEQVTLRFLPGNHDPDAAIALTVALSVAYSANPRVTVDDSPSHHWYLRHGAVMLGATHGHTMKPDRMAMMLATDRPRDWGETRHRHFFFGHIHHETAREVGPVRVESFNTLAAKDAYAHAGGWRSGQSMSAITFHREDGEIGRHRVNWSPPPAAGTLS